MQRRSVMIGVLAGCVFIAAARADDWPGWQGPNRDAKSAETGLLKKWPAGGPSLLWKAQNIGKGFASVAVSKGVIYTTGDVGETLTIFALDINGNLKWKVEQGPAFKKSNPGSRSTPVIDDTRLYVEGGNGLVTCHDIADGKQVWKRDLLEFGGRIPPWGYSESVLVLDNMAIVTPGGANALVALDKKTGKNVWLSNCQAAAHYSSPVAIKEKDSTVIVQGTGDGLVAVNAKDGKKIWSDGFCTKNTANCPTPAYSDGYLFWANGYNKGGICVKVEYKAGKWHFSEAWKTPDMVCHHGGYIIEKGCIYGNHNSAWSCLDLKTGNAKWKGQPGVGKGSLCYADGMLYLFGEKGGQVGLAAASPQSLEMAGSFKVAGSGPAWAHPVVSDGKLFIRYDTNLYCFDVKGK